MNRIDLQAPTLAGPPWTTLGAGTASFTSPYLDNQLFMYTNKRAEQYMN